MTLTADTADTADEPQPAAPRTYPVISADSHITEPPNTYVDFIRDAIRGNGAARAGDSRWRRIRARGHSSAGLWARRRATRTAPVR